MFRIFENSLYVLGNFLGPLFGAQVSSPLGTLEYFEKLIVLLIAIICWVAFERSFLRYIVLNSPNPGRRSTYNSWVTVLGLIISAMISLGTMHALKVRNEEFVFSLFVAYVLCRIIKIISVHIKSPSTFYPAVLFEHTILGGISFFIVTGRPDWQPLVVGLGYGFSMTALIQARSVKRIKDIPLLSGNFAARIFTICFSLGPILWSLLAFAGQLPKIYSAFILLIIPFKNLQGKFTLATGSNRLPSELAHSLELNVLTLIISMLLAAALMLLL